MGSFSGPVFYVFSPYKTYSSAFWLIWALLWKYPFFLYCSPVCIVAPPPPQLILNYSLLSLYFFFLVFCNLTPKCQDFVFLSISHIKFRFLDLWLEIFHQNLKILVFISSNIVFPPSWVCSSLSGVLITLDGLILSHWSLVLCLSIFHIFLLCFSLSFSWSVFKLTDSFFNVNILWDP